LPQCTARQQGLQTSNVYLESSSPILVSWFDYTHVVCFSFSSRWITAFSFSSGHVSQLGLPSTQGISLAQCPHQFTLDIQSSLPTHNWRSRFFVWPLKSVASFSTPAIGSLPPVEREIICVSKESKALYLLSGKPGCGRPKRSQCLFRVCVNLVFSSLRLD
jgi:hypothetical protein